MGQHTQNNGIVGAVPAPPGCILYQKRRKTESKASRCRKATALVRVPWALDTKPTDESAIHQRSAAASVFATPSKYDDPRSIAHDTAETDVFGGSACTGCLSSVWRYQLANAVKRFSRNARRTGVRIRQPRATKGVGSDIWCVSTGHSSKYVAHVVLARNVETHTPNSSTSSRTVSERRLCQSFVLRLSPKETLCPLKIEQYLLFASYSLLFGFAQALLNLETIPFPRG